MEFTAPRTFREPLAPGYFVLPRVDTQGNSGRGRQHPRTLVDRQFGRGTRRAPRCRSFRGGVAGDEPIRGSCVPLFLLGPTQGALLAIWTALGRAKLIWRVLPMALGVILYVRFIGDVDGEFVLCTIGELVVCTAVLFVARLTGLEMVKASDLAESSHPFQFYIRDILIWTTALAVFLSAWQCLSSLNTGFQGLSAGYMAVVPVDLTIVAVASMFLALGRGWIAARTLSLPLAIGAGAALIAWTISEPDSVWFIAMALGFMAFWLVASLLVLRFAGYRLAWRPELAHENTVESQDASTTQENPGPPHQRPLH